LNVRAAGNAVFAFKRGDTLINLLLCYLIKTIIYTSLFCQRNILVSRFFQLTFSSTSCVFRAICV